MAEERKTARDYLVDIGAKLGPTSGQGHHFNLDAGVTSGNSTLKGNYYGTIKNTDPSLDLESLQKALREGVSLLDGPVKLYVDVKVNLGTLSTMMETWVSYLLARKVASKYRLTTERDDDAFLFTVTAVTTFCIDNLINAIEEYDRLVFSDTVVNYTNDFPIALDEFLKGVMEEDGKEKV